MAIYSASNEFQSAVEQYNNLGNQSTTAANQSTTAALEQCMLLSRINDKLLEESGGNVNNRSYKKTVKKLRQMCTNLKKVQFCKDVAVGRYLIENQERDVSLSTMSKRAIYKKFIYVPKPKTEHMPGHMLDQSKTERMPGHMLDQSKTERMPGHMLDQSKTEHMSRHMLDQSKQESVLKKRIEELEQRVKRLEDRDEELTGALRLIKDQFDKKSKPGMFESFLKKDCELEFEELLATKH
jgi:hypothetical protein